MMVRAPAWLWLTACASWPADQAPASVADGRAVVASGGPCSTGCKAPAPKKEPLGDRAIRGWLAAMADGDPLAVDTLLFHPAEVVDYLDRAEDLPLGAEAVAWLRLELGRADVRVGFRLVDEAGDVLGHRDDRLTLGEKVHLVLRDTGSYGRAEVNGRVERVGVKHLWARF